MMILQSKFMTLFALYLTCSGGVAMSSTSSAMVLDSPQLLYKHIYFFSRKEKMLESSYYGYVRENETDVVMTPPIETKTAKICILKARRKLNCELRNNYYFKILAISCDGNHSTTANVYLTVLDVNEYQPVFFQPSYATKADEDRIYHEIISVKAFDKDCTPLFGNICKYEILNKGEPFVISNGGSIRNTEILSHNISNNHILTVVAYDCAMKQSIPILITIEVRRVCSAKFMNISEKIDYMFSIMRSVALYPNSKLEMCDVLCEHKKVRVSVTFESRFSSNGCNPDVFNCYQNFSMFDLLPRRVEGAGSIKHGDDLQSIFHFNGITGVIVPNYSLPLHDFSMMPFTIITTFRHLSSASNQSKHIKEHIICSADDKKMNRHHIALFVRNCRLILLLRKYFNKEDMNIFSPAEWRWKIPQVCDNKWHRYVIKFDLNYKITLYIDSVLVENTRDNHYNIPEIIDDWPLHTVRGISTVFMVGACYQSTGKNVKHCFKGDISEIKLLLPYDSFQNKKCTNTCPEFLFIPIQSFLGLKSMIQYNVKVNEIILQGSNLTNMASILQKIQYVNTNTSNVGRRNVQLQITVICNNPTNVHVSTIGSYVYLTNSLSSEINIDRSQGGFIESPAKAISFENNIDSFSLYNVPEHGIDYLEDMQQITIYGKTNLFVSYNETKQGVYILDNISIITSNLEHPSLTTPSTIQQLKSCQAVVYPSLNPDHEIIKFDDDKNLSPALYMKANINKDGVYIIGSDSIANYIFVLKAILYSNKKPAYYLNRMFKVTCIDQNYNYNKAEFTVKLTILHPRQITLFDPQASDRLISSSSEVSHYMRISNTSSVLEDYAAYKYDTFKTTMKFEKISNIKLGQQSPTLVVLLSLLVVILISGASMIRLKKRKINHKHFNNSESSSKQPEDDGFIWDDSAINIIINPIQNDMRLEHNVEPGISDLEDGRDYAAYKHFCFKHLNDFAVKLVEYLYYTQQHSHALVNE